MWAKIFILSSLVAGAFCASAPSTLDLTNGWVQGDGQDFTTASDFNRSVWSNVFGNAFWFSGANGLFISSSQTTNPAWQQSGFMQLTTDKSAGYGYGVFHFRSNIPSGNSGQGYGINLVLWNGDGSWLSSDNGDRISEVDILEANGNSGFSTLHWCSGSGSSCDNGQQGWAVNDPTTGKTLDLTEQHDFDLLWQAGLMALYIDGHLLYNVTGEQVPADYAHGGIDKTIGAQVVIQTSYEPLPTVQLYIQNMWHYTSGSSSTPSGPPPSSTPPPPSSPPSGAESLNCASPGTMEMDSSGHAQASLTVTGSGLDSFYWVVVSAAPSYSARSQWNHATLTNGKATIQPTFFATGDFVKLQSDLGSSPAVTTYSSAATLTPASASSTSTPASTASTSASTASTPASTASTHASTTVDESVPGSNLANEASKLAIFGVLSLYALLL